MNKTYGTYNLAMIDVYVKRQLRIHGSHNIGLYKTYSVGVDDEGL